MIALALLASVAFQDTNTAISPRVRGMLERFPPPAGGIASVTMRFSRDTVWLGEQVELVTVTWLPRALRDRLPRAPGLTPPSLTGLWSARNQQLPILAGTRMVGGQLYIMYVSWQTIFPLGGGRIEAPPTVLTYGLPTSTSYFAPEEAVTIRSAPAVLIVRPVPAALAGALGTGPTAHNLRLAWRSPATTLQVGSPTIVELAVSGDGNLALWPAPQVAWPAGVHVYPEPTDEQLLPAQGLVTGEKRFRFTVVPDSAGVLTLPAVRYPYFDPAGAVVEPVTAAPLSLAILPRPTAVAERQALTVTGDSAVPFASIVVRRWPALVFLLAIAPVLFAGWRRRVRVSVVRAPIITDPEVALRVALGTPVEAGEGHVIAALRSRGVPRDDAEHVRRWLAAVARWRYGPQARAEPPTAPPAVSRVITRLRRGAIVAICLLAVAPLRAQHEDGVARFTGHDYEGAARAFAAAVVADPLAAGSWRDLGSARWMAHDDVGAAAAWLRALALSPRDELLRDAWHHADGIPGDVRGLAPVAPVSRDELILLALACWCVAWLGATAGWRRTARVAGALCALAVGWSLLRWQGEQPGEVLVRTATTLHISPHPATASLGELPAWTRIRVGRQAQNWVLANGQVTGAGGAVAVQGWIPVAAIAPIGPLD